MNFNVMLFFRAHPALLFDSYYFYCNKDYKYFSYIY